MRPAITMSVVGGVLLLSAALAYGGGPIEASTTFLLAWGKGNWDDLATVATEAVTVTVGGKVFYIGEPPERTKTDRRRPASAGSPAATRRIA